MITIQHSTNINKPVTEVFQYVADSRNDSVWCQPVKEVQQIAGDGPQQGAKYSLLSQPGPFPVKGEFKIIGLTPLKLVEYTGGNTMIDFDYQYEFSEGKNSSTTITMVSHLRPKGFWKILTPIIRSGSKKAAQEEFKKLKSILENS